MAGGDTTPKELAFLIPRWLEPGKRQHRCLSKGPYLVHGGSAQGPGQSAGGWAPWQLPPPFSLPLQGNRPTATSSPLGPF